MIDPHQNSDQGYLPLYHIIRGESIESIHFGMVVVVEPSGKLFARYGNPDSVSFLRSSAKPFQAIPLVELGGMEAF